MKDDWLIASKDGEFSIVKKLGNPRDNVKWLSLEKLCYHKVKATGTLQHREVAYSPSPAMTNVIEQFYFDIAEVNLSDEDSDKNAKPPSK